MFAIEKEDNSSYLLSRREIHVASVIGGSIILVAIFYVSEDWLELASLITISSPFFTIFVLVSCIFFQVKMAKANQLVAVIGHQRIVAIQFILVDIPGTEPSVGLFITVLIMARAMIV